MLLKKVSVEFFILKNIKIFFNNFEYIIAAWLMMIHNQSHAGSSFLEPSKKLGFGESAPFPLPIDLPKTNHAVYGMQFKY